jgi:20S proteasome alpha/beta subunit
MTIICAQKTTTGVLLGADNHSSDSSRLLKRKTPKLHPVSERVAFGCSGHTRLFDRLRDREERGEFPDPGYGPEKKAIPEYELELARFFRRLLKDEFFAAKESKLWTIVAVDDHIFDVGPDGSIVRIDGRFMATGSVEQFALGSLFTINKACEDLPTEEKAKEWLQTAMEACAEFGECIRPPWSFLSTTRPA